MSTLTLSRLLSLLAAIALSGIATSETVEDASWALAQQQYPELRNANSVTYRAFQSERTRLARDNPSFFSNPEWPLTLARYVSQKASQPSPSPVLSAEGQYLLKTTRSELLVSEIRMLKERRDELRSQYNATLHAAWQLPMSESIPGVRAAGKIMQRIKPLEAEIEAKERELATLTGQKQ